MPKRYTSGVTNVARENPFGQLPHLDPTQTHVFMDDFDNFNPMDWIAHRGETTVAGVTQVTSREQISDARLGVLSVVTTINDNDYTMLQRGHLETYDDGDQTDSTTTYGESFALASAKKVWFKARLKADDVDTCSIKAGLILYDATDPVETAQSDGLWFQSDDGDANLDFYTYKSSVATVSDTAITTIADDTYFTVAFYFDGSSNIYYYVNDSFEGSASTSSYPTGQLLPSFGIMNGSAAQSTLSVDFICAIEDR